MKRKKKKRNNKKKKGVTKRGDEKMKRCEEGEKRDPESNDLIIINLNRYCSSLHLPIRR